MSLNPYVALARAVIEGYVRDGRVPTELPPAPELRAQHAGAFVSLHIGDELRGCIGTIEPCEGDLYAEIVNNAVGASTRDPRFPPVTPQELPLLDIKVDVLQAPTPVASLDELDPQVYGCIVECGLRRGLLLPDLEGIDTASEQVAIAMRKAGIDSGERVTLQRFRVDRYHETHDNDDPHPVNED